jgi:ribonuclease VapC
MSVLFAEDDAREFVISLQRFEQRLMSSMTLLETYIVAATRYATGSAQKVDLLLSALRIEIIPQTKSHVECARQGFEKYGKGRGHKAQLNFGDCAAYGLAKSLGAPLLFKGTDFSATDIKRA